MSVGKSFVRLWKVYMKHRKHEQLVACEGACLSFSEFLRNEHVNIDTHYTFDLVVMKISFYRDVKQEKGLAKVISNFLESHAGSLVTAHQD